MFVPCVVSCHHPDIDAIHRFLVHIMGISVDVLLLAVLSVMLHHHCRGSRLRNTGV
jgi:hypothetical protein